MYLRHRPHRVCRLDTGLHPILEPILHQRRRESQQGAAVILVHMLVRGVTHKFAEAQAAVAGQGGGQDNPGSIRHHAVLAQVGVELDARIHLRHHLRQRIAHHQVVEDDPREAVVVDHAAVGAGRIV